MILNISKYVMDRLRAECASQSYDDVIRSFEQWLLATHGIDSYTSPDGLWSSSHDLIFVDNESLLQFKLTYL